MLSKTCTECYDRIPLWVMAYIYRRLGVPNLLYKILMGFLSAGDIDISTAYGWIKTGKREFGLGQGPVLSICHITYYMDILLDQNGPGAIHIQHGQLPALSMAIASTVFVDDAVDA